MRSIGVASSVRAPSLSPQALHHDTAARIAAPALRTASVRRANMVWRCITCGGKRALLSTLAHSPRAMNFLFKTRQRMPGDVARAIRDATMRMGVVHAPDGMVQLGDGAGTENRRRVCGTYVATYAGE